MKNKKNIFYILIICLVFILGVYFRLKAYFFLRPIWIDESWLFFNIYELRYIELFQGLKYAQSAPPIFLAISKFIISNFGIQEIFVRLLPFICSLVSIPVFYKFSKIFLKKKWSVIIANILFGINIQLITYSQEFKQYSSDVLITMILFIILYKISIKKITNKQILLYIVMTTICPLISLPSYFIFAGWFLREFFRFKKEYIIKLFIIQIPMFLTTTAYYFAALRPQRKFMMTYVYEYWKNGFITTNLQSNISHILNNLKFFFYPCNNSILQIILISLGIYILIMKYKKEQHKLALFSLLTIFICSFLKLYPTQERIILYLIPLFIVIITINLDFISIKRKFYSCLIILFFMFAFNNYNIQYLKDCNNNRYGRFNHTSIKKLSKILKNLYKPQDTIYIDDFGMEYRYYKLYYNIKPAKEVIISPNEKENLIEFDKLLNNMLKTTGNSWVLCLNEPNLLYDKFIERKNENKFKILEYKNQNLYLLYLIK